MKVRNRKEYRQRRHQRVRQRFSGSAERPRLSIMMTNRYIYVQFIDDDKETTLAHVSAGGGDEKCNMQTAVLLGKKVADTAKRLGVAEVVVDRGGFKYHGRVKAIVDSMKASGVRAGAEREAK
jgi:large subunit ribosomal protein L18